MQYGPGVGKHVQTPHFHCKPDVPVYLYGNPMSQVVSMAADASRTDMKMQGDWMPVGRGQRRMAIFRWMDFKQTYKNWKGLPYRG